MRPLVSVWRSGFMDNIEGNIGVHSELQFETAL